MNAYLVFIVGVLVLHFFLESLSRLLNIRAMRRPLPSEFSDTYAPEKYRESLDYSREHSRLKLIESSLRLVVVLGFILMGGFGWVDQMVRGLGWSPLPTGLVYIGALLFAEGFLDLPFTLYSTFSIEARYGFNRTTLRTFVFDRIKGMLIGALLGGVLLGAVLYTFGRWGAGAWLPVWGLITLFIVFIQFLAPTVIMPLFNRFTPLEEGALRSAIEEYSVREGFALKGIYTMDGSRRSTKLNAYFTGFGRSKRIVFFDTLVDKLETEEILAVLAHEMGHYKKRHILQGMGATALQNGIMLFLFSLFLGSRALFDAFGMELLSVYGALVFFLFLYTPISLLFGMIAHVLSRRNELEADHYAARTVGSGEPLISGLKKLSRENFSFLTPNAFFVFLHYSHPPVLERIQALRNLD